MRHVTNRSISHAMLLWCLAAAACKENKPAEASDGRTTQNRSPIAESTQSDLARANSREKGTPASSLDAILVAVESQNLEQVLAVGSKMTLEELRSALENEKIRKSERAFGTLLLCFAAKAGEKGAEGDFKLIADSKISPAQIESALKKYFSLAREGPNANLIFGYLDALGPGAKRDVAVRSYFNNPKISLEDIATESAKLSFPEDRKNALIGASASRDWTPESLGALTHSEEDRGLMKLFLRRYVGNWIADADNSRIGADWEKVNAISTMEERQSLQKSFLLEVGLRNPSLAVDLISKLSDEDAARAFRDPDAAKIVSSWCDKDPGACMDYLATANIEAETTSDLVAAGVSQWLLSDSIAAGRWLSENAEKPYSRKAIGKLVSWLEAKGENADQWKKLLSEDGSSE